MHFDVERFLRALLADLHPRALLPARIEVSATRLIADGSSIDLTDVDRVHVLGLGKAAVPQVEVVDGLLRAVLGPRVTRSLAVTKHGHGATEADIDVLEASHPLCDESSLRAAETLIDRVKRTAEDDLVVLCLSGGGSSLAAASRPPFTLSDTQRVIREMLDGGASIAEINGIRREMSRIKNGGLLFATRARRVVTLITSDVPNRDLGLVASGPTLFRPIDEDAVRAVAQRYLTDPFLHLLVSQLDDAARARWHADLQGAADAKETVAFAVADYDYLLQRARVRLNGLGMPNVESFTDPFDEPIESGVERHLHALGQAIAKPRPSALISGGELPVRVTGNGEGGRNTEFVLRLARALFVENRLGLPEDELESVRVLSFATDGTDGPTDHAGGWLTLADLRRATEAGHDLDSSLARNDSLGFLRAIGCALHTGPTGTNLMDLRVISRE